VSDCVSVLPVLSHPLRQRTTCYSAALGRARDMVAGWPTGSNTPTNLPPVSRSGSAEEGGQAFSGAASAVLPGAARAPSAGGWEAAGNPSSACAPPSRRPARRRSQRVAPARADWTAAAWAAGGALTRRGLLPLLRRGPGCSCCCPRPGRAGAADRRAPDRVPARPGAPSARGGRRTPPRGGPVSAPAPAPVLVPDPVPVLRLGPRPRSGGGPCPCPEGAARGAAGAAPGACARCPA